MKIRTLLVFLFLIGRLVGQNLVPNPSFENYSTCPTGFGQLDYAIPWLDPNNSTSDYMHGCSNSVPCQIGCIYYQCAHSGIAYAALEGAYHLGVNYREYIQVQLISPLVSNQCYYVEFFTNHLNDSRYAINNIGAYISSTAVVSPYELPYNLTPQILLPGNPVISDTVNWIKVYGVYQATGGEDYKTIGNFQNDSNTVFQIIDSAFPDDAAYYIDDVDVHRCSCDTLGTVSILETT